MVTDYQPQPESPSMRCCPRSTAFKAVTVLLAAASVLAVTGAMMHWLRPVEETLQPESQLPDKIPGRLFAGWPKPDAVIVISGQQYGYMLPCGCSEPQKGGLERRYNLIQMLKARGWPVTTLDLGDVAQSSGPAKLPNVQGAVKYKHSMDALDKLGTAAVGIGENEMQMPFIKALGEWALNNPSPRLLAANLADPVGNGATLSPWKLVTAKGSDLKIGVVGAVGASVQKLVTDPDAKFNPVAAALPGALADLAKERPDVHILLYQGSLPEATSCAAAFPQIQVIVCLREEEEPPSKVSTAGATSIIQVGHKGKYVGVLGLFKKAPNVRYELVEMGEEYKTSAGQIADHPIAKIFERYTLDVKTQDLLHKYTKTRHKIQTVPAYAGSTYVGSEACKKCHESEYAVWAKSKHAHAYDSLVAATHPSNRQFDGECVVCHVTGFANVTGFVDDKTTPKLKHVGCEACHGPASIHVANMKVNNIDPVLHDLMNKWKKIPGKGMRKLRINDDCRECHDSDNDVHWDVDVKWPKIEHPMEK